MTPLGDRMGIVGNRSSPGNAPAVPIHGRLPQSDEEQLLVAPRRGNGGVRAEWASSPAGNGRTFSAGHHGLAVWGPVRNP